MNSENAEFFVKATNENMQGHHGFQFELGKIYEHQNDPVLCCVAGFHCCDFLEDIFMTSTYTFDGHNRYFIVKAWGQRHVKESGVARKYAFQCMEFVKELKWKTRDEINQSMDDMQKLFDIPFGNERIQKYLTNVQQFQKLVDKLPKPKTKELDILKRRDDQQPVVEVKSEQFPKSVDKLPNPKTKELDILKRRDDRQPVVEGKSERVTLVCMPDYNGHLWEKCSLDEFAASDVPEKVFDIYHLNRKPALGLCFQDAKLYLDKISKSDLYK